MISKKRLAYKTIGYSTAGLALFGSSVLVGVSANQHLVKSSAQMSNATTTKDNDVKGVTLAASSDFTIRSNPTNGFNGLRTEDGKYTYVLITKKDNGSIPTPDKVGGSNSGIACINNNDGTVAATWYLPAEYNLNYTTNIVFGQKLGDMNVTIDGKTVTKKQTVFDETKLFVLCGISNLAAAINSVYTAYDDVTNQLTTDLTNAPTIKIFQLSASTLTSDNSFYNFAYPSDGVNGYAGFNSNGYIYDMQYAGDKDSGSDKSLYYAKGIKFSANTNDLTAKDDQGNKLKPNGITRTGETWGNAKFTPIENTTIGAFGSYLTYLTYGQNFAYHLGETYKDDAGATTSSDWSGRDEFIMTTSFVNVDQTLGGLYSATIPNMALGTSFSDGSWNYDNTYFNSYTNTQKDWPVPFGYQWLLASIAYLGGSDDQTPQYSYVDANGNVVKVLASNENLALKEPILKFLKANIFPSQDVSDIYGAVKDKGNLLASSLAWLKTGRFGANWGFSNGYIIYTPAKKVSVLPKPIADFTHDFSDKNSNVNEYRYYYIAETALRDWKNNTVTHQNESNFLFTNLLATNQLSLDGSLSYVIGAAWTTSTFFTEWAASPWTPVGPFSTLYTPGISSMFNYDWASLSNDDNQNALIQSLDTTTITTADVGGLVAYYDSLKPQPQPASVTANADPAAGTPSDPGTGGTGGTDQPGGGTPSDPGTGGTDQPGGGTPGDPSTEPTPEPTTSLVDSFRNWNLVFLGGPSATGVNNEDSLFSIDPHTGVGKDAWDLSFVASITNPGSGTPDGKKLGVEATYLRRKISFAMYARNGYVYATSPTGLEARGGFSLWGVRNSGGMHTAYLPGYETQWYSSPDDYKKVIWSFNEVDTQNFGYAQKEWSSNVLTMTTDDGIYTVSGGGTYTDPVTGAAKTTDTTYTNLLIDSGNSSKDWYNSADKNLLNAISFTSFGNQASTTSPINPAVTTVDYPNQLHLWNATDDLYSIQVNVDYTTGKADVNAPDKWKSVPAAKPALKLDDNTSIAISDFSPDVGTGANQLTYTGIDNMNFGDLINNVLKLPKSSSNYTVDLSYNQNASGPILQRVYGEGTASNQTIGAKIAIPVTYQNQQNKNIVYFAPIKDTNGRYQLAYTLTGLKSEDAAPIIIVLREPGAISAWIKANGWTNETLIQQYGGKDYDAAKQEVIKTTFVNKALTENYLKQLHGKYFATFEYWLLVSLAADGKSVDLSVRYKMKPSDEWTTPKSPVLCPQGSYRYNQTVPGALKSTFETLGYQPTPVFPGTNAGLIIGVVVAVLAAVTLLLGLGIGLPMRKQHKINVLNSKITNKRIDKLSTAVSASFKKVLETTAAISKDVSQLKSSVHRSLAAGHPNQTGGPNGANAPRSAAQPRNPGAPTRPGNPTRPTGK